MPLFQSNGATVGDGGGTIGGDGGLGGIVALERAGGAKIGLLGCPNIPTSSEWEMLICLSRQQRSNEKKKRGCVRVNKYRTGNAAQRSEGKRERERERCVCVKMRSFF